MTITPDSMNYEQAVHWLRLQPNYRDLITLSYLDQDNLKAAQRFAASEEFKEVVRLLAFPKQKKSLKLLDLGCGNGIASYAFAQIGIDVTSVDPDTSDDVGLEATSRLSSCLKHGSITSVKAFAEELPFSDNTFDVIYSRQALHHFSNLQLGLEECYRVLKKNGRFLAVREHVIDDDNQLKLFLESHVMHQLHGGENAYKLDVYLGTLKRAKFKIIRCLNPYSTVINYYPTSSQDIQSLLSQVIAKKFGYLASKLLINIPLVDTFFRYHLTKINRYPGRLYSFLCSKS